MTNRIIPCLDIDKGRVVKGKAFKDIRDVGDPVEFATSYNQDGADEITLYDITASTENRSVLLDTVKAVSEAISVPLIVGGGLSSIAIMKQVFAAGASKVSLNSAPLAKPELLKEAADTFGKSRVILSMDVMQVEDGWHVFANGGKIDTNIDAIEWAKRGEELGAGEIVLNAIDTDGKKDGYKIALNKAVSEAVSIPVIASGGAGKLAHFSAAITEGKADAVLAASVFHYGDIKISDLRAYLQQTCADKEAKP